MGSRSRSKSQKKHKHKQKKREKSRDKEKKKNTRYEDTIKSQNWNEDKVQDPQKKGFDVLQIIQKEREEDEQKLEQWKQKVGYTGIKVKNPLNIYEEIMKKNIVKPVVPVNPSLLNNPQAPRMIEVIVNDRLGKKERIKLVQEVGCCQDWNKTRQNKIIEIAYCVQGSYKFGGL
ncbi:hypothetical protein pb186bvf_014141 [Paramecium bursaria]